MKILFVCQQYIHAARWINQLKGSHHEIFVFDCLDAKIHSDLKWTHYYENWSKRKVSYVKGEERLRKKMPSIYEKVERFLKVTASEKLEEIIKEIQPDLVHSIEMQSETYPLIKVRKKTPFRWAFFCWGNDLFYFKELNNHKNKIQKVLSSIDYFFSDTIRDFKYASELGYKKEFFKTFPGGGGYKIHDQTKLTSPIDRKLIIIKGYHHRFGRALKILQALELISVELKGYDIYVYSAHNIVVDKIKELNKNLHLEIKYSSRHDQITHDELLNLFGKSFIAIGNSISDGIPNTMLESIILGAFPIQSNPGGATEDYIKEGINGLLISNPEDAVEISELILKTIKNKELVELAFNKNQEIAKKLEYKRIQKEVLKAYSEIEESIK
jgi:glycosyltransferase involved in cell wall biosynthesis